MGGTVWTVTGQEVLKSPNSSAGRTFTRVGQDIQAETLRPKAAGHRDKPRGCFWVGNTMK